MKRSVRILLLLASFSIIYALPAIAQEEHDDDADQFDADWFINVPDNPVGRAEYERLKRADPATGTIPAGIHKRELEFAARIPSRESFVASQAEKSGSAIASGIVEWYERGPINQGGRTRAIGIDRTNESVFLAGGISGGMWRSENIGKSWARVSDIDQTHSVTCLEQDSRPGAGNVWYYGTGEWRANSANLPGDGIFKSTDGGRSWTHLTSTSRNTPQTRDQLFDYVHKIVVDPSNLNQDEVYAACYGGIARSTDGGETWEPVLGSVNNNSAYTDVAITSKGVVYATLSSGGTVRGVWRSDDGITWTDITPTTFAGGYNKISIGIAPSNENLVYFFGNTPNYGKNDHSFWVYRVSQAGVGGWENRSVMLPGTIETYTSYCIVVRVKPNDENTVFIGNVNVLRSTNGFMDTSGMSIQMGSGQHADQHEIVFMPSNPNVMMTGHDGGISLTWGNYANQIMWESLNNRYVTTQFYSVAIDHAIPGSQMIIGGTQDNGTWFVNNDSTLTNWKKAFGADGGFCAIADSGTNFYMSYQNGQIYRNVLDSNGISSGSVRIDPDGGVSYLFIHPFTLDPSDTRIMYLPEGRNIWRNSDLTGIPLNAGNAKKTINWSLLENARIPANSGNITAVGLSKENPAHRLYYGTSRGRIFRLDQADTTTAASVDVSGNYFPTGYISCITVDPHNANNVLVAISSYNTQSIFSTTNGGTTWDTVSGNLEEHPNGEGNGPSVSWVSILPVGERYVYLAGTTTGLYSTTALNGMNTFWVQEGASTIGNIVVDMIDVRESDGFVAVGSHGRGMFSTHVTPTFLDAVLGITPSIIEFGDVPVNTSVLDTLTIMNTSGSVRDVQATVPQLGGIFEVVSGAGSSALIPGQTRQVVVRFTPDSAIFFSEKLQISHDGTSPQTPSLIWLTGRGIKTTGVVEEEESLLDGMSLRSYPNPFSKSVELRFRLKRGGDVSVKVLSVDGSDVESLYDGRMEEGEHVLTWSPKNVANGVYYVRVESGTERRTMSVVLER